MKRFWLVLLSLGLVLAFSASAMAVDVKFSGSFFAAGMYLDKTSLTKDQTSDRNSTAFYYQRLRLQTDFIVSPGLKLVTRADILERIWGGARSTPTTTLDTQGAGTRAEAENIRFDLAYIEYASPIGVFQVGYGLDNIWGTQFGDNGDLYTTGKISYMLPIGNFVVGGVIYKEGDKSWSAVSNTVGVNDKLDQDSDKYVLYGLYNLNKDINFGLLYSYSRVATYKATGIPSIGANAGMIYVHTLQPYFKAQIGPVYAEGEFGYAWGYNAAPFRAAGKAEDGGTLDTSVSNMRAYLKATADFKMFYFGGIFAYVSGDDPTTSDKLEGGSIDGGADFNPCLIMFNQERFYWAGGISGYPYSATSTTTNGGVMTNIWFGQLNAGVRPIAPLTIGAAVSYGQADQKPTGVNSNGYGWEIDVTATYKITNNLSYMLGGGYWFVGDYYKGSSASSVKDEYMLINKLILTF
jgi:hypothetical protein